MESKQKYKVFINDQSVLFADSSDACPANCIRLYNATDLPDKLISLKPGSDVCVITENKVAAWSQFTSSYPIIQAAGGVVTFQETEARYLLIFRLGKWDLPKGKIDPGESPYQAAIREVEEECGIHGMVISRGLPDTWHMYKYKGSWVLKQTYWYEMSYSGKTATVPQTEEGIQEVRWVTASEMAWLLPDAYASIRELLSGIVKIG